MKKEQYNNKSKYGTKIVIFSGFLVLFLIVSSTIVMASTTSDQNTVVKPFVAPEDPHFVKNLENKLSTQPRVSSYGHQQGYKYAPVSRIHLRKNSNVCTSFPAHYDLRIRNKVTPVKDQGNSGCCGAFATYGSLESYLKPNQNLDFSENNLKNMLSNTAPEGFDFPEGVNEYMSTAYLARWSGPVSESDDPYSDLSSCLSNELGLSVKKHVQNVLFIPDRTGSLDNSGIKSAVEQYGALFTCMYCDPICYNSTTCSYYYDGTEDSNHAVVIVGWDDNFNKNKFANVPPGNGAFIVKNSWGTSWGDKGYFYISYYDSNIGKYNAMFTAENTNGYHEIYQYDPLGFTADVGYNSPTAWSANIFTADACEVLNAVSFYTTDSNCKYELYINNKAGSIPNKQSGLIPNRKGTVQYAGYHTVQLDSGIKLKAGQKYSIVLKLTNPNYYYPIATEMPISGYSSKATASLGQSFISPEGKTWTDITTFYPNTNVCIKAFS